jgi:hypothetical protein
LALCWLCVGFVGLCQPRPVIVDSFLEAGCYRKERLLASLFKGKSCCQCLSKMSTSTEEPVDLGMRQRKSASSDVKKNKSGEAVVAAQVRPFIIKAAPVIGKVALHAQKALPYVDTAVLVAKEKWELLKPYKLELLTPAACGLILCFFGGSFLTLIAAVEAFRMAGHQHLVECFYELKADFELVLKANADDDSKDEDGDGVADVLQVSKQELLQRKVLLFFRTVDPRRVHKAISGISHGFLAIVATLKVQFAKAITLGNAIGDIISVPAHKFVIPPLREVMPPDYRQWAAPIVDYAIKSFAISLAWSIQRVISAFHSAMRGGLMFSRNIIEYLCVMKILDLNHEETIIDEVVGHG